MSCLKEYISRSNADCDSPYGLARASCQYRSLSLFACPVNSSSPVPYLQYVKIEVGIS
jgi:hypothetical protein